jgi:putative nucleotidyltransferase with HDIG domain
MTREEAWKLLTEYTQSESLRKHALAVEGAMRGYARRLGEDEVFWGVVGLLHDFDYERWPDPKDHTEQSARILGELECDVEMIDAIRSHAPWNWDRWPLDRPLRKALFAVDELSGFIVAVSYVRPGNLEGMKASSVKKKMKQKGFAAAVSRDDIRQGAELMGVSLEEHIEAVIGDLQLVAHDLGLS